jgi:hypothetical protein
MRSTSTTSKSGRQAKLKLGKIRSPSRPQWFSTLFYLKLGLAACAAHLARAAGFTKSTPIKYKTMAINKAWDKVTPSQKEEVEEAYQLFKAEQQWMLDKGADLEQHTEYVHILSILRYGFLTQAQQKPVKSLPSC